MLTNEFKEARLRRLAAQKRIEAAEEKIRATFLEREFGKKSDRAATDAPASAAPPINKQPPKK